MSCGVGHRHGLDLALLWLWHRPVVAVLIRLLAWETPYATCAALKVKSKKAKKKKSNNNTYWSIKDPELLKQYREEKEKHKRKEKHKN